MPSCIYSPILSMVATLMLAARAVNLDEVPGFDRLWGLMVLLGVSFGIALAITKTRLWILFGGSILTLFLIAAFAFALLKWGAHLLFRRGDEPKKRVPSLFDE